MVASTPAPSKAASSTPTAVKQASSSSGGTAASAALAAAALQAPSVPSAAPATTATAPAPAANPALGGLRSEYAMLAGRANSVSNSLGRMEQQQAKMGVGLRGDMAAARDSMEYLMGEAKNALTAGDADGAKRNLGLTERQIEKLEDFPGR